MKSFIGWTEKSWVGQVPFVFRVISWAWKWGSKILRPKVQLKICATQSQKLKVNQFVVCLWLCVHFVFMTAIDQGHKCKFYYQRPYWKGFWMRFCSTQKCTSLLTYLKKREFLKWTEQQVHSFYCPIKTLHFLTSSLCNFFLSLAKQFLYGEINKSGR